MSEQVVVLHIGAEEYAINIAQVREIIVYQGATKIPNSPSFMEGIINLRNQIIPVLDLGKKLGVKTQPSEEKSAVIIEIANQLVAFIVDQVSDVINLEQQEIEAPPQGASQRAHLRGVGKKEGRLIILLQIDKLFEPNQIEVLKKI